MDTLFFKSFLGEFFLLFALLSGLVYNAFLANSVKFNFPLLHKDCFFQTLFILVLCFFLLANTQVSAVDIGQSLSNDILAQGAKIIIVLAVFCSLVIGQNYFFLSRINNFEFFSVVLLALLSLFFLISSTSLISIYITLEMQALSFYILAAISRYSAFSTEAGLKYFVLGAFLSGVFLFGASLLYGTTGCINLHSFSLLFSDFISLDVSNAIFFLGVVFILVTFLFKLSAAPFHIWSPDVYEGAPLSSTILFVLVPKLAIFVLLYRIFYFSFFTFFDFFQPLLLFSGVCSVIFGSLMAIRQKRLKRLLVYSSISHVGFILLGFSTGTLSGVVSVFYYLIFYIITNILIWGLYTLLATSSSSSLYLSDLSGLMKTHSVFACSFILGFFSLAGIPPLVGFSMKYFIFTSAIFANFYFISSLVVLLSVLSSIYYLKVIKIFYFETRASIKFITEDSFFLDSCSLLASCCLFLVVWGFFNPNIFLLYSYKLALGLSLTV